MTDRSELPAAQAGLKPRAVRRCPICGKLSFRTRERADEHIAAALHRARTAGLILSGETPHGLPVRSYPCEDGKTWHVTSQPLPEFTLPTVSGSLQDIDAAIKVAISQQTQITLFPRGAVVAEHFGITRSDVVELRRGLRRTGWLEPHPPYRHITVRPKPELELELPPCPADRGDIPYVLVDAIRNSPVGAKIPKNAVLMAHFGITSNELRLIRRALCELGWLVMGPDSYFTDRPPQS
jgi:hypothetical protein